MRAFFTPHFQRSYATLPAAVQRAFEKQLALLLENLRHPSLRAKKYNDRTGVWQARVTRSYRFYFTIEGDAYILHEIIAHPK